MFLDPLLPWLDARCLTKLLMTGDRMLKNSLRENVTEVIQYYHADPVVDVWQFPSLALVSFPKVFRVVLVTDRVSITGAHNLEGDHKYHPLRQVDLKLLPSTVTDLVLKFGKVMSYSWKGVVLPNLRTVDIDLDDPPDKSRTLPVRISSKLVNPPPLPKSANNIDDIKAIIAQTTDAKKVKLSFLTWQGRPIGHLPDILHLNFTQHYQLSSLSLKSVSPIIDLFALPRTLTELHVSFCNLTNHEAIELFPLITLILEGNTWYGQEVYSGSGERTMQVYDALTITFPSTVLEVVCDGSLRGNFRMLLKLPNSVTSLDYRATMVSLEFHEPDAIFLGLLKIVIEIDIYNIDAAGLNDVLNVIYKSPNLRTAEFDGPTERIAKDIIDALNYSCPQLEKLQILTWEDGPNLAAMDRSVPQIPPYSLVELNTLDMFYQQNLLLTADYFNLQMLAISIDLRKFTEFNQVLQNLPQLRHLELSANFDYFAYDPEAQYDFPVSAPPSLTALTIEESQMLPPSSEVNLVVRFAGKDGIPPKLRSIHLDMSNIIWDINPQQVEILPTTLEWCYPPLQSPTARARLFNLVDGSD